MKRPRLVTGLLLVAALPAATLAWAAFAPMHIGNRDEVFAIPKGTWARRMGGDKVEILPREIRLVLGINDVLVLENHDDVPQVFGPALLMPGQRFRLPFEQAASYQFACTANASGQMTITVAPGPEAGWERLRWRYSSISQPSSRSFFK